MHIILKMLLMNQMSLILLFAEGCGSPCQIFRLTTSQMVARGVLFTNRGTTRELASTSIQRGAVLASMRL